MGIQEQMSQGLNKIYILKIKAFFLNLQLTSEKIYVHFFLYNMHVYACVSKIKDEANYIQQMLNVFSYISSF